LAAAKGVAIAAMRGNCYPLSLLSAKGTTKPTPLSV